MRYKAKSEIIQVRVTPEDKAAIQRAATKAGMNVSDYLRACALTMMCTEFDRHALKALVTGMGDALAEFAGGLKAQRKLTA